jgi:phosphoglycolate phosphatase
MQSLSLLLSHKEHIIWDWNGTLLDDVDLVVEVISDILVRQNLSRIDREEYRRKFCFPIRTYYERLGFDFDKVPYELLAMEFIDEFHRRVIECPLHLGARELLVSLKENGKSHSVLSAAHEVSLREQLSHHRIEHLFDHIYGLSDHHAVSKVERGKELIRDSGLSPDKLVLVGDTDHDLEVGSALGVDVVLLADGHQSYERLSPLHSHVIADRTIIFP